MSNWKKGRKIIKILCENHKNKTIMFNMKNKQQYLRFKNIPKNEISGIYDGDYV